MRQPAAGWSGRSLGLAGLALVVGVGLVGCGSDGGTTTNPAALASASGPAGPQLSGKLTVLAAASLTESFNELGQMFEAAHPGLDVQFSFGASSALAQQITSGAPADLFASASAKTMQQVVGGGDAAAPKTFARNALEIAVPPANPAGIDSIDDLAKPGVKVSVCDIEVPCGAVAQQVFSNAGITVTPVTFGQDVKAVLTSVSLGEVDAGVVYVTDVQAAGTDVTGVEIPADVNASTDYPIAALTDAPNPTAASEFAAYVLSDAGQAVLTEAGFQRP